MRCNDYLLYTKQKLVAACRLLAILPGDVRSRLKAASVEICVIRLDDVPQEVAEELRWIIEQMTRYQPQSRWEDGPIDATMARIKRKTGSVIATRIVDLYYRVEGLCEVEPGE